jgi:hypothetical protein
MRLRIKDDQPSGEFGARIFHVVFGVLCVCGAIWVLFSVSPFNPFAFFILLLLGVGPLLVGLYGDRKTVFQLLFLGGS